MSYNTEQMREYMRERRKNLRAQGLCVQCGKYSGARSYCETCAAKAAANNRKWHKKKREKQDCECIAMDNVVSKETFEQVVWERDVALQQRGMIGKGLASKMDDVAHIIRCKDCKHYYAYPDYYRTCHEYYEVDGVTKIMAADDFCSHAERKTDGTQTISEPMP